MSFEIHPDSLATIRSISQNASTAEGFFQRFVESVGGLKTDCALDLKGACIGGADYLFRNGVLAELKILEKDGWDDYNKKMDRLFAKYRSSGELAPQTGQEEIGHDDPRIPSAMRTEWYSILLGSMLRRFRDADRQIGLAKGAAPKAKGVLILLNIQNRLHAEPVRLYWLVRDKILSGSGFPNIEAWFYLSLPVPELMSAGINQCMFSWYFPRAENEMPDGWKDQNLFMKCRGIVEQWKDFLEREIRLPINNIPLSEIRIPKP
jgi:hypothetical protein